MLLAQLVADPEKSLNYLERYVNDGSPSGYTEKYRTIGKTDPFGLTPWFYLYLAHGDTKLFTQYGIIPYKSNFDVESSGNWIFIHPDMVDDFHSLPHEHEPYEVDALRVVPTSSGRTVRIVQGESRDYIKLHYSKLIGRIDRSLPYTKSIAGPEISQIITEGFDDGIFCKEFAIFEEIGARVFQITQTEEWGMVWRRGAPSGPNTDLVKYIVPYFSMFSTDRLKNHDQSLLVQIINFRGVNPEQFALSEVLFPIAKIYFQLLCSMGLQIELNAQNVLLGLDENMVVRSIILRDFMGVEKDITLRKSLDLGTEFLSSPYKCIFEGMEDNLYTIRHSFSFDFKLCCYVFDPLIDCVHLNFAIEKERLIGAIKEFIQPYIISLPGDFYPIGNWYNHEKVLLNSERKYIMQKNPRYRQ